MAIEGTKIKDGQGVVAAPPQGGEAQLPETRSEWLKGKAESFGELAEEAQGKIDAQNAKLEEVRKKRDDALKAERSILSTLVEDSKPKYDEKAEKRLRWRGIINSLGNMLSAAASGVFAFKDGGQGLTPMALSEPMKDINKISEMQEKYQRERKAWQDLDFKVRQAKASGDVAAAEALLSKEEAVAREMQSTYNKLLEKADAAKNDAIDAYYKDKEDVAKREQDLEDFNTKEAIKAQYNNENSKEDAEAERQRRDKEDLVKLQILDAIDPYKRNRVKTGTKTNEYGIVKPYTDESEEVVTVGGYNENEKKLRLSQYEESELAKIAYHIYSNYGVSIEKAIEDAKEYMEKNK